MSNLRLGFLVAVFFLLGAFIIMRFFSLQITNVHFYRARAQIQQERSGGVERGNIFVQDREGNLFLVATTKEFNRLWVNPSDISVSSREEVVTSLSSLIDVPEGFLLQKLSSTKDSYEFLGERIPLEKEIVIQEALKEYFGEGFRLERYTRRFYPYEDFASHTIGFLGFIENTREGVYGIERFYNEELGQGADVLLTLDFNLQQRAQTLLEEFLAKWESPSGSIVVMRPNDGAILAMASKPDFNPNMYQEIEDFGYFLNPAVQKIFEPGSIVKPITIAGGIETGAITPTTSYVDKGFVERGGYIIRNAGQRVFGKRTIQEVLAFSINTGAVFTQESMGQENFLQTLENVGFGQATGVDLPGEQVGDITNLDSGRPINFATASFGQGISATPLQVIAALGAIANEGVLMRPYLAHRVLFPDGTMSETVPHERRRAMSQKTAAQLIAMMIDAVEEGYGKAAQVPGYLVAGKTGTAQIPDPQGGYLEETIHSFVGFAPAFNPAFIMFIKLDKPMGTQFASESIAPLFSEFAEYILQYYHVLPEKVK